MFNNEFLIRTDAINRVPTNQFLINQKICISNSPIAIATIVATIPGIMKE